MVRGGGGGRSFLALDSPGTVLVATARDPAIYEYAGAMRQATNEWASGARCHRCCCVLGGWRRRCCSRRQSRPSLPASLLAQAAAVPARTALKEHQPIHPPPAAPAPTPCSDGSHGRCDRHP